MNFSKSAPYGNSDTMYVTYYCTMKSTRGSSENSNTIRRTRMLGLFLCKLCSEKRLRLAPVPQNDEFKWLEFDLEHDEGVALIFRISFLPVYMADVYAPAANIPFQVQQYPLNPGT